MGHALLYSRVEDGILFNLPKKEQLTEQKLDQLYAEIVDLAKLEKWQESENTSPRQISVKKRITPTRLWMMAFIVALVFIVILVSLLSF